MKATRRAFVVGSAAALAAPALAQTPDAFRAAAAYSAERRGVSLVVMRAGRVLFEDYPGDGGASKGWELASGTKSFTGIMAAAMTADGLLDIDAPCAQTLPEWGGDPLRRLITVRHLLTLTSGLEVRGPTQRPPPYAEAVKAGGKTAPGARFQYGPTPFQAFGEIMVRKLKAAGRPHDPAAYIQSRVFDRIGVKPTDWKRGSDGYPFLPQGAHLTGRDWARFGQWVFDGAAGVDAKVREALFTATKANPGYGLSWWLLRPGLIGPSRRAGVDETTIGAAAMEEDVVMAAGAGDQRLYLIRKRGLVVARQANQILRGMGRRAEKWSDGEFLRLLSQAF